MTKMDIARAPNLTVPHGFLGRTGGVSTGDLTSLNCGIGSNDDPAAIAENRRRAVHAVAPGAALVGVYQVHGRDCVTVTEPWFDADRPHADALVTATPGVALSILTADCAPVLFADVRARVVGAAHAGWKGALAGVTDATIEAMEALGARREDIAAAIGPCIAQASYEVGEAFADNFSPPSIPGGATRAAFAHGGGLQLERADCPPPARLKKPRLAPPTSAGGEWFTPGRPGHLQFDLEAYVAHCLAAAGIGSIHRAAQDTLAQPGRYFSYRRATLAGEPGYGRQISIIALD